MLAKPNLVQIAEAEVKPLLCGKTQNLGLIPLTSELDPSGGGIQRTLIAAVAEILSVENRIGDEGTVKRVSLL